MTRSSVAKAFVSLAAVFLLGHADPLQGQTIRATILGTITDQTGGVVPGAQVVVTETGTNTVRTTPTNASGFYAVANLDPGNYRVEVEHPGFRRTTRANIDLRPNTTVRIDLELQPGVVTEIIDVTASAPLLQTDRADTGGQLQSQQLVNMPLSTNRNYQGALMMIPGVGRAFKPHSEFYNSQDSLAHNVNGQQRQANNFQLEGMDNNIEQGQLTGIVPPIEAIATVDVTTTNYDPEFGRAGGAVANVTLRSGTNEFHGSAFHFHQNENLQARNVFATDKAHTVYNQFGGTLGGPIRQDRTFFFGSYQGTRDRLGNAVLATIPTMPFRTGNLSDSPTTIYDPLTGTIDGRNRTAFPDQQIPVSRISPITQRILGFIPEPTRPGLLTNFERNLVRVKSVNQYDIKVDHVLTDNDRLMFRYSYQKVNVVDPGLYGPDGGIYGGPHNAGFSGRGPARSQSPGLNYSRVFSPTLVMETRFAVFRNRNDALNTDHGLTTSRDIGIPGVNIDDWSSGLSEMRVDGYSFPMVGFNSSLPWARAGTTFGIANNWTKTTGNHVIKMGGDIRRFRIDLQQTDPPRGRFNFTDGPTSLNGNPATGFGNAFASFLLDQPNQIQRGLAPVFPARRRTMYSLYVQDKWQVIPRLTLDLGLRWEFWPSETPRFPGGFANYNPFNNTLELAGFGNIPLNMGVQNMPRSFAPRIGLAYRIDEKTVFRGGYGISYLQRTSANYNFPVRQNNVFNAPNTFATAGSLAAGIPPPDLVQFPADGIIRNAPVNLAYTSTLLDLPHTYVQSWNVALQRALPWDLSLDVAYVGSHNINDMMNININAGQILGGGAAGQPLNQLYGRRASTNRAVGMHQYYNGLQVKFDKRFADGFMLTTAYASSRTIDF
jgi:hypothetical protein